MITKDSYEALKQVAAIYEQQLAKLNSNLDRNALSEFTQAREAWQIAAEAYKATPNEKTLSAEQKALGRWDKAHKFLMQQNANYMKWLTSRNELKLKLEHLNYDIASFEFWQKKKP